MKPEPGTNISKSQTYGKMKSPRCTYPGCKYNSGFPDSWNRIKTDEHEQEHKQKEIEDSKQEKLF